MTAKQDGPWPDTVFSHGDLNAHNILVRGDKVVAIVDWEGASWFPHYWEYTSTWYGNIIRPTWRKQLSRFLDPCLMEMEMEMEKVGNKWWGAW